MLKQISDIEDDQQHVLDYIITTIYNKKVVHLQIIKNEC